MTQTEYLAKIRAECVGLLDRNDYGGYCSAGCRSTIAAIDLLEALRINNQGCTWSDLKRQDIAATTIIAAWPEELL